MFAIDFTKPYLYKDVVYFHQGNLSTNNTLRCTLNTGGSNDLTGCNIICTFKLQNSTEISGAGRIIDPLNAIVDLVFPSNALAVGLNKLEILVNRSDGSVAQSPSITYDIWQGLTTGNGIEAEINYPILIELINSTNEASNKANSALNKANSMITDITDAIDNAYRSANEADIATSNANTKIEEVETAKTEMIKKVDTSIVTMKSEVETAKNEMASKADEKIADVDRALAAGTVDLEVKQARKDASGVVYENLKQMLDANLGVEGKTLKDLVIDMNNMKEMQDLEYETDKGYAVCEKTANGTVKDLKIYGRSLNNISKSKSLRCVSLGNGLVESKTVFDYDLNNGDEYTICFDVLSESTAKSVIIAFYDKNGNGKGAFFRGDLSALKGKRIILKVNILYNDLPARTLRMYTLGECLEGEIASIDNIVLLKGDHTQNPPSGYFEGIASVGNENEIECLSTSKNIAHDIVLGYVSESGEMIESPNSNRLNMTRVIPNSKYIFSKDGVPRNCNKFFYDIKGNYISKDLSSGTNPVFTTSNNCYYVVLVWGSSQESGKYQLEIGDTVSEYVEPKQDKKTTLYKDVDGTWKPILNHRGIDENNCDIIDSVNNLLHENIDTITINGSENWVFGEHPGTNTISFACNITNRKFGVLNMICDKFPIREVYSEDYEGIRGYSSSNLIMLRINRNRLSSPDLVGLKKWLQGNNVVLEFAKTDTKTYEINPIYPEAFEGKTLMLFKTGPISPRATWKITSNLVGVLGNVKDRVKRMENDFYKYTVTQNRMQLGTTYSSDRTTFRVDTATFTTEKAKQELDYDLFRLLKHNILVGPHNYDKSEMENMMDFYVSVGKIDYNMWDELYMLIEEQHNPPVEEEAPVI